jgi:hypothetical protein
MLGRVPAADAEATASADPQTSMSILKKRKPGNWRDFMMGRNKNDAAATIQYPQVFHGQGAHAFRSAEPTSAHLTATPARSMVAS